MGENNGSGENTDINITYETIFELLRREKNRDELQKLNETFYLDVRSYLSEKNSVFLPQAADMFSDLEREKTTKQVSNTKRMLTELFERREKKIIILALNKVRTSQSITDMNSMLSDEKDFFYRMTGLFGEYRDYTLKKMTSEERFSAGFAASSKCDDKMPESQPKKAEEPKTVPKKNTKTLRILSKVPKFMGKELEVYGPFNPDDMASLPSDIAEVLIKKGRAEEINIE